MSKFKKAEKLGRQAWLASLGAYGSGWKYAVEKLDETYTKTNALMSDLISEGEKLEVELQEKLDAKAVLNGKINALKDKLGLNKASDSIRLVDLNSKIDGLVTAVENYVQKPKKAAKKKVVNKKAD